MKHLLALFLGNFFFGFSGFSQLIMLQPNPDSVCNSDIAVFIVEVADSTTLQWQYSDNSDMGPWFNVPIIGFIGAQTDTLQVTQPGDYDGDHFRVLVMDTTYTPSNETSDSVLLTVFQNPTVEMVSVPGGFAFCEGGSIVLQTMDMDPSNSYIWSPMGETTPTINVMSGGIYSVIVTDLYGCNGSSAKEVMEFPAPTPLILPNAPQVKFCPGDSVILMSDSIYTEYNWSSPPGGIEGSITVNAVGNYILTVTDSHGCTASTSRMVDTFPSASPPLINPILKEFCQGDSLLLMGNSGYMDYMWSTGGDDASLFVSSGDTYTLTVTDFNGCTNSGVAMVIENALPNPLFTSTPIINDSISAGRIIKFTDASNQGMGSAIDTWTWNFGQGSTPMDMTYPVANNMTNVTFSKTGPTMVCLEAINQKSCHDTNCDSFLVTTGIGPIVTLEILNQPRCLGDTFCLRVTATNQNPNNDSLSQEITWQFDPSLIERISISSEEKNNLRVKEIACFIFKKIGNTNINALAFQFNLTNIEDPPLEGSDTMSLTSGSEIPRIDQEDVPDFLCRGETIKIIFNIEPAKNGIVKYNINSEPFSSLVNLGKAEIPINTNNFGNDQIELDVFEIEIEGCKSDLVTSWVIEIRPLPLIVIAGMDIVCVGDFEWLVASGAGSYDWKINNAQPPFSTNDSLRIKSDLPGEYIYTVVGTLNECSDRDSTIVLVAEPPTPEIFGDSVVCKDQVVQYLSHDPIPVHIWNVTGGSIISQDLDSVSIQWNKAGQGTLRLTQNIGKCTGERTEMITVSDDNSPPFNSIVWLKGGRILLYPNPELIPGLCYQWYKDGSLLSGETYQGFVVPVGVSDSQLSNYSVKVWFCAEGDACAQSIVYRSPGSPSEETEPRFQVVPNPNSGTFDVQYYGLTPGHYVQNIIGTSGRILYEQELDITGSSGTQPVSARNLSAAVYFVRWVNTTSGYVLITQIIILP